MPPASHAAAILAASSTGALCVSLNAFRTALSTPNSPATAEAVTIALKNHGVDLTALPNLADPARILITQEGDIHGFHHAGRRLYLVHPTGTYESVTSYRDAAWKLGMDCEGAVAIGSPRFVKTWADAVAHTFPSYAQPPASPTISAPCSDRMAPNNTRHSF